MLLGSGIPAWVERLILQALKGTVTPEAVRAAIEGVKADLIAQLKALAAKTENEIDDRIVGMVEDALTKCRDDLVFVCELIAKGKRYFIDWARAQAKRTDTILDDAAVDILEAALFPPAAAPA